jgi:hypothetical protein
MNNGFPQTIRVEILKNILSKIHANNTQMCRIVFWGEQPWQYGAYFHISLISVAVRLSHGQSSLARTLRLWVRIPLKQWMSALTLFVLSFVCGGLADQESYRLRLRNLSAKTCFTDAICSKCKQARRMDG